MDRKKIFWLIGIFLSFSYELPILMITSMDRFNPRVFDILFLIGLILFKDVFSKPVDNDIYKIWSKMVKWMAVCCFIYILILPFNVSMYSVYYLLKYIEGILVIRMILSCIGYINLDLLEKIFIVAGLFIAVYSIPQYQSSETIFYELAPGKMVALEPGTIIGPYTGTYFSLAQIVPICSLFALSRLVRQNGVLNKLLLFALYVIILFPGINCGSRTAFYLTLISSIVYLLYIKQKKYILLITIIASAFLFMKASSSGDFIMNYLSANNATLARQQELDEEGGTDSTLGRLMLFESFGRDYDYEWFTPFVGAGFYVAPRGGNYRIGYGEHNNYLFALEQMGLYGAYLFIMLFVVTLKKCRKNEDNLIGPIGFSYFFTFLFVNMSGQTFWHGFGTVNMNTLVVALMVLSVEPTIKLINKQ